MAEFREEDCEVWRQSGTDPGWRAKHKPSGIVISSGHSWQEERPDGMIDGLRRVWEREQEETAKRNAHYDKLGAEIAAKNGWTVHCRGGCSECNWQGFLLPDGTPIPPPTAIRTIRKKAWVTRRKKYGPNGNGKYVR